MESALPTESPNPPLIGMWAADSPTGKKLMKLLLPISKGVKIVDACRMVKVSGSTVLLARQTDEYGKLFAAAYRNSHRLHPDWEKPFLEAFARVGNKQMATRMVPVPYGRVWRRLYSYPEFKKKFEKAELEYLANQRKKDRRCEKLS